MHDPINWLLRCSEIRLITAHSHTAVLRQDDDSAEDMKHVDLTAVSYLDAAAG